MAAMMGSGQLDPAGTALIFEERGDHRGTFVGQHAAEYFEYMVVCTGFEQSVRAFDGAGFGLGGAVNQARDACMNQGAEAHRAELDRHLQRRAGQTVITPLFRGGCQRDNFCMRAGILRADRLVVPTLTTVPVASTRMAPTGTSSSAPAIPAWFQTSGLVSLGDHCANT